MGRRLKKHIFYYVSVFICSIILMLATPIFNKTVKADDEGYYIKNYNIKVEVNDKREFQVTETIDVFFNEERHGILRDINKSSSLEDYNIKDVSVTGAPYEMEDGYSEVSLKIGDPDEEIKGDKTYVVKYTLAHYNDEQSDGDYIYLNLLPSWDVRVENFKGEITYPNSAKINTINLTDGYYGSKNNTYTNYYEENNKVIINSKSEIPSNSNVTLNIKLNDGVFKNAPVKEYKYYVNNEVSKVHITENKEYIVNKEYEIEIKKDVDKYSGATLPFWDFNNNELIYDFNISQLNLDYNLEYGSIYLPKEKGIYKFNLSFKVKPKLKDNVIIPIKKSYSDCKLINTSMEITSDINIGNVYNVRFSESGLNKGSERFLSDYKNNTFIFNNLNTIYPSERIYIEGKYEDGLFTREITGEEKKFIKISLVTLILTVVIALLLKDKKIYGKAVAFYPPENLNSAEVGYCYKKYSLSNDITSLIFYWASKGKLKISFDNNKSFILSKVASLDDDFKPYETKLFNALFRKGKKGNVKERDLKDGALATDISVASKEMKNQYKNGKKLRDNRFLFVALGIFMINIIPLFFFSQTLLNTSNLLQYSRIGISLLLFILNFIFFWVFYLTNDNNNKGKITIKTLIGLLITLVILVILNILLVNIYGVEGDGLTKIILGISLSLISFFAGLLPRRTKYGNEMLDEILGFRNFLLSAEKERLEMLIDENPSYFYDVLPYAQVLGVTDKFKEKFASINMAPCPYYSGSYTVFDYYMMTSIVNSVSSVTKVASSSNPGDFSGGSGGGFSGGGFSGGGSGGGSGSSW